MYLYLFLNEINNKRINFNSKIHSSALKHKTRKINECTEKNIFFFIFVFKAQIKNSNVNGDNIF